MPLEPPKPLHVLVLRTPFSDFFVLQMDDGQSEEFEPEDCRAWFKDRGANMDKVEAALDHCWNFQRAEILIHNPKEPSTPKLPHSPNI